MVNSKRISTEKTISPIFCSTHFLFIFPLSSPFFSRSLYSPLHSLHIFPFLNSSFSSPIFILYSNYLSECMRLLGVNYECVCELYGCILCVFLFRKWLNLLERVCTQCVYLFHCVCVLLFSGKKHEGQGYLWYGLGWGGKVSNLVRVGCSYVIENLLFYLKWGVHHTGVRYMVWWR